MTAAVQPFGLPVLPDAVPVSPATLTLITRGIRTLWQRIVSAHPGANVRPLLLSYDVHPTPDGPVLIEINTNAGGILTAIEAARHGNDCCADWERRQLEDRLVALFRRDLLGPTPEATGVVAIVDDELDRQALLPEMHALAGLMRPYAQQVRVVDAAGLVFADGRLRHEGIAIDRIYWRSTDFMLDEPRHAAIHRAVQEGSTVLAPSPDAYAAIADKRRFLDWSAQVELSRDEASGIAFRIAETQPLASRPLERWYAERSQWVFKPVCGHASRGVYVGRSISRAKLAQLPAADYLAQRYAPHPVVDRAGAQWKYDVRFFADRDQVIGAAARVFQGQVVGMKTPGSGFAPIRVGEACCLIGAFAATQR